MAARIAGADTTFKIMIENAKLLVRKIRLSDSVFLAHAKALEYGNAKYPIQRVECKRFLRPTQSLDITQEKTCCWDNYQHASLLEVMTMMLSMEDI